jgi:L-iditol 2-dehydrogenase
MLAAVYYGPNDVRLEERPVPSIGADEALLRVSAAGICGTDLRILHGQHRYFPPGTQRIPGHEVVGEIAEVGSRVKELKIGQRVMVAPNIGCGHCRLCISGSNNLCHEYQAIGITMDGGFAEYMRIPAPMISQGNVIRVDPDQDPAVAALIEPFACVLRGQRPVEVSVGDNVLIMGAGPIGLMHLLLARLSGASQVIVSEVQPARLIQARELGADRIVNPEKEDLPQLLLDWSNNQGADVIIVAAPSHTAQQSALELAAIGGRINFFGGLPKDRPFIEFDSNAVHYKELRVTGTTACSTGDCHQAAAILNAGRIDLSPLVRHRFPLAQVRQAFESAENRTSLKVVIEPHRTP